MVKKPSRHYPLFLDLEGRPCVVVGGGAVAGRKVRTLLEAGATVTVVSPSFSPGLKRLLRVKAFKGRLTLKPERFRPSHLKGALLVFAATDDPLVNGRVCEAGRKAGALVNVSDLPEACDFLVPSAFRQGDLQIAISTGGRSPAAAKRIREELEARYGPEWKSFLRLMGRWRRKILTMIPHPDKREKLFNSLARSDLLSMVARGAPPGELDRRVRELIKEAGGWGKKTEGR